MSIQQQKSIKPNMKLNKHGQVTQTPVPPYFPTVFHKGSPGRVFREENLPLHLPSMSLATQSLPCSREET